MVIGHAVGFNRPSCSQITAKEDKINAPGYRHSDKWQHLWSSGTEYCRQNRYQVKINYQF